MDGIVVVLGIFGALWTAGAAAVALHSRARSARPTIRQSTSSHAG